jgi:membrane-bound lytic murein transglycosylase D
LKDKDEQIQSLTQARDNLLRDLDQARKAAVKAKNEKPKSNKKGKSKEDEETPDAIDAEQESIPAEQLPKEQPKDVAPPKEVIQPEKQETKKDSQSVIEKPKTSKPVEQSAPDNGGKKKHKVEAGDTLFKIARKYGIKPDQIRQWNNMTDNTVKLGAELIVGE